MSILKKEEAMNISEAIRKRRSIRKYKEGVEIPRKDIETILEAAMMAPSARNTRPWEFVVVESREGKEKIMEIQPYTGMLKTASAAIIVCGLPEVQKEANCSEFWPEDCGAAIENILLQALELGYGTCWCGFYPVEDRVKALKEAFDLKSVPLAVVALGVPDEEPAARGYFDPEKVRYI